MRRPFSYIGFIASLLFIAGFVVTFPGSVMAQTYSPTKAGLERLVADDAAMLPSDKASGLKKILSDWEAGKGVNCSKMSDGSLYCLPNASMMIREIQGHFFRADGYSIAPSRWALSFPQSSTQCEEPEGPPVDLQFLVPQVVRPETLTTKEFNKDVRSFALGVWSTAGGPLFSKPKSDGCWNVDVDYSPNPIPTDGVISIAFSWGNSVHGNVHGEGGTYDFNWNVAAGRPIQVVDIFDPNTDWKTPLVKQVNAHLQSQNFSTSYTEVVALDINRWAILKAGLRVDSDTDEFGPFMFGAVAVTIPWTDLKPYLKKGGLVSP